jgi:hypothetical protein
MKRVKLRGMPRKPKSTPTAVVRVEADLAQKLKHISAHTNEDVSDIISPQLRPFIERRYAEVLRHLCKEVKEEG